MDFIKKIDKYVDDNLCTNDFSGLLRVTEDEHIIYERFVGYGDIENKIPINRKSVFTFYSLSKPFCAIGLMKLYDQGLIDIDKHPGEYIKEARGFDDSLTIRHMLHHESGLPDFLMTDEFVKKHLPGSPEKIREHVEILQKFPMHFKPGDDDMYANINYNLSAVIIENVSGMKYSDYMRQEVFIPLGMNDAAIDGEKLYIPNRVKAYTKENEIITETDRRLDWMMGAGDMIGTVDDVYCLNKAIKNNIMLKEKTWETMLSPSREGRYFGIGCGISNNWHGKRRITHNGGYVGFRTMHVQLRDKDFDIIYMSNCDWIDARQEFVEAVYEAYFQDKTSAGKFHEMDKGYI